MSDSFIYKYLAPEISYEEFIPEHRFITDGRKLDQYLQDKFERRLHNGYYNSEQDDDDIITKDELTDQFQWSWTNGRYFTTKDTRSLTETIKWMRTRQWPEFANFYEMISDNQACKFYMVINVERDEVVFDDDDLDQQAVLTRNVVIQHIINFFDSKDIQLNLSKDVLIFSIREKNVRSFHIVIDNYVFLNRGVVRNSAQHIYLYLPKDVQEVVDMDVYQQDRLLTLYSCKEGSKKTIVTINPPMEDDPNRASQVKWNKVNRKRVDVPVKTHEQVWMFGDQTIRYQMSDLDQRLIRITNLRSKYDRERIYMNIMLKHSLITYQREVGTLVEDHNEVVSELELTEQDQSDEIIELEIASGNSPDDLLYSLLETYQLLPFNRESDQNRFSHDQLTEILRAIKVSYLRSDNQWLFVTGMIKSCRLKYEAYQPYKTEDEVLKELWVEWTRDAEQPHDLSYEWLSRLWAGLPVIRNGLMKFNSFDLLKVFKDKCPKIYESFMSYNRKIRTFNYIPKSYELPDDKRLIVDRYTAEKIKPFDKAKTIELVKSKMDTQKTRSLLDYINTNEHLQYIIYVTCRYTMSQDASQVLSRGTRRHVFFYKELDERVVEKIDPRAIIVIQAESLHKLSRDGKLLIKRPGLLILDECTSCCTQLSSPTMKGHEQSIKIFRLLIKVSAKIIAMDADVDDRIVKTLLRKRKEDIHVQWNEQKYNSRTSHRFFDEDQAKQHLYERLKNGEKIFIVCSTRTKAHELREALDGSYKVLCHTGGESTEEKATLFHVNELWINYQVVIITSTVTVGVNFFQDHFDTMFIFGQNGLTPSKRDIKQMTGRVRKLRTGLIFIHLTEFCYDYPVTYDDVRDGVQREYKGRVKALEHERDNGSLMGKSLAMGVLVRYKSSSRYKLVDEEIISESREESWITQIHVLNILERNISNVYFEEEFEFMLKEQGITVSHIPITPPGDVIELNGGYSYTAERVALYEETDVVTLDVAKILKVKINRNTASLDERFQYTVYTVCKHLIKKPSYDLFEHFEKNYGQFMRIIADRDGDPQSILRYEETSFVHRSMNTGTFHQWSVMKDFAKLIGKKNVVEPFKFNTRILQEADRIQGIRNGQINVQWTQWINRAKDAFMLPATPIYKIKDFMKCLKKILKNWSGVTLPIPVRKKYTDPVTGIQIRSSKYRSYYKARTQEVISLLCSHKSVLFVDDDIVYELELVPEESSTPEEIVLEIIEDVPSSCIAVHTDSLPQVPSSRLADTMSLMIDL